MIYNAPNQHPPSDEADVEADLVVLALLASRVSRLGRHPLVGEIGHVYVADLHRSGRRLEPYLKTRRDERKRRQY